jgi:hypothetical protein
VIRREKPHLVYEVAQSIQDDLVNFYEFLEEATGSYPGEPMDFFDD